MYTIYYIPSTRRRHNAHWRRWNFCVWRGTHTTRELSMFFCFSRQYSFNCDEQLWCATRKPIVFQLSFRKLGLNFPRNNNAPPSRNNQTHFFFKYYFVLFSIIYYSSDCVSVNRFALLSINIFTAQLFILFKTTSWRLSFLK